MEPMGKLSSNYTTNIGMIPSASKYVSINFSAQCLYIINNKERFNVLKSSTKTQERDIIPVQTWKLHGIILMEKMPGPNFGSDR